MCSIGIHLQEACNVESPLKCVSALEKDSLLLLALRTNCDDILSVCMLHESRFLKHFSLNQKSCDPLFLHPLECRKKSLRGIASADVEKFKDFIKLVDGKKTCISCRKALLNRFDEYQNNKECVKSPEKSDHGHVTDDDFVVKEFESELINKSLHLLGESPIDTSKLKSAVYPKRKFNKIKSQVKKKLKMISPAGSGIHCSSSEEEPYTEDNNTMLEQLKEKFSSATTKSEKITVLSVLPKNWSVRKVQQEFGASNYMVRKTKKLVEEKGILVSPNPKPGKTLPVEVAKAVQDFYEDDEMSRLMPGMKDYILVRINGKKEHQQKRLILANLKEIYSGYKAKYKHSKIGFSKFAELRPKHCILPGASGTHTVCVCTIHQNVKLMLLGGKLALMPMPDSGTNFQTYHHIIAQMICNPSTTDCHVGNCPYCPGIEKIKLDIENLFEEQLVDEVTYKQWLTTDRCTLETIQKPVEDFIDSFIEKIEALRNHDFIAKQQAAFLKDKKATLLPGEVIVSGDFAENYSFVIQNAAQGFHWNNTQATLHPFVCYYRDKTIEDRPSSSSIQAESNLQHFSVVFISDSLTHDTVAVHTFQKRLIPLLCNKIGNVSKIIYFSDGAASQYKNKKNFQNICLHEMDFKISAEWHFFATSHGKGPCDGVGGAVKRLAARASLQRPDNNQIMSPLDLFEWAKESLTSSTFVFVPNEEIETNREALSARFQFPQAIPGTRSLHAFVPISENTLRVQKFSSSADSTVETILPKITIFLEKIKDFVSVHYGQKWWLGFILNKIHDTNEVKIRFLHPHGPSPSFTFPAKDDELTLPVSEVLTLPNVELGGSTGRTYKIPDNESTAAARMLKARLLN